MNLQWFRDLANLAQVGNFSRAAELSASSQPAFSRRIKALEDWVGTALVDRASRPVRLTQSGEQMLEAGNQALRRIESSCQQVRESIAAPDRYVVTFAAQHTIGWRFYPQWLQAFEASFGPILSRLRADNLPDCLAALSRGEVDFVMAYDERRAPASTRAPFESIIIGRDLLVPVSKAQDDGSALFALGARPSTPIPYLRFGANAPLGRFVEAIVSEQRLGRRLNVVYENSMGGALRIHVREGLGVAWLPLSLVEPDIEAGLLARAGGSALTRELVIRLYARAPAHNALVKRIWTYLARREGVAFV
ncbi:MAG: LysR family transcriptional regulator [Burkholderiaceae bacterium]